MTVQQDIERDRLLKQVAHWQERCQRSEEALARARTAMPMTALRRVLLCRLGDLKPTQWLSAKELRAEVGRGTPETKAILDDLVSFGWLDRSPAEKCQGLEVSYRLAYLATPPEDLEAEGLPLWQPV